MPLCFVIMPYGGNDERLRRHFAGVYQSIIVPAALKAGYEVKRSDITGEPGNITDSIVRDLANAEIVIADLTAANPNVFFELGIRHVLRKSGTVHIIDATHQLPFDVRQYRAIEYTTELADLPRVIDEIASAVHKRTSQPNRSDNPVHDAIPELPVNVLSTGDAALQEQIRQMQATLYTLQEEKEKLEGKLLEIDPSGTLQFNTEESDVDIILDQADEIMRSTGQHVLLRLNTVAREGGIDQFVRELREALKSPYLTENDFQEISLMCVRLGLPEHRRAILEIATKRYPAEDLLFLALVGVYDDSTNPVIKERGRLMLEQYLLVRHEESGPVLAGALPSKNSLRAVTLLFNFYTRMKKPEWVLSLARSAEARLGTDSRLVRNAARALADLGKLEEAEKEFKRAIEADPTDDTAHSFLAEFLDDQGRYEDAYIEREKALILDPEDGDRYIHLAIQILNRGLSRDSSGNFGPPAPRGERVKTALPFLLEALIRDPDRERTLRQTVVGILVRASAVAEAEAIANNKIPEGAYDNSALAYVQAQIAAATTKSLSEKVVEAHRVRH